MLQDCFNMNGVHNKSFNAHAITAMCSRIKVPQGALQYAHAQKHHNTLSQSCFSHRESRKNDFEEGKGGTELQKMVTHPKPSAYMHSGREKQLIRTSSFNWFPHETHKSCTVLSAVTYPPSNVDATLINLCSVRCGVHAQQNRAILFHSCCMGGLSGQVHLPRIGKSWSSF